MSAELKAVSPPRADDDLREQCRRLLSDILEEANGGEIETVLVIARRFDGRWKFRYTGTKHYSDTIGQLEIVKSQWISDFLADNP